MNNEDDVLLTQQEVACLRTALALVVVRRRLAEKKRRQANDDDNGKHVYKKRDIPIVPYLELAWDATSQKQQQCELDQQPPQPAEHWRRHCTHMLALAQQEARCRPRDRDNDGTKNRRLESLAMHIACQLEAWSQEIVFPPTQTVYATQSTPAIAMPNKSTAAEITTPRNPVQEWIHAQLFQQQRGKDHIPSSNSSSVVQVWSMIIRARPLASQFVPVLYDLIGTTKIQTIQGHAYLLLEIALEQASTALLHETVQLLLLDRDTSPGICHNVADLAMQYHKRCHGTSLLIRWAKADLLRRLLTRLEECKISNL